MIHPRRRRVGGGAVTNDGSDILSVAPRERRMRSRLNELMKQHDISLVELSKRIGVGKDTLRALKYNDFTTVSRKAVERIVAFFNLPSTDALFIVDPVDIWSAMRLRGVTIHVCSSASRTRDDQNIGQQRAGLWDLWAQYFLYDFLKGLSPGIDVRLAAHIANDPASGAAVSQIMAGGNHIILGSPLAGPLAEFVVAHLFGETPFAPKPNAAFPMGFVWDAGRSIKSSLGWSGKRTETGIVDMRTGELIARSTMVGPGEEGHDACMVVVSRSRLAPKYRKFGPADENILVLVLGCSGCGTLGGAQLLADLDVAAELYPPSASEPVMRAIDVVYTSPPVASPFDNRQVIKAELVLPSQENRPEPTSPSPSSSPTRRSGGKPRRRVGRRTRKHAA